MKTPARLFPHTAAAVNPYSLEQALRTTARWPRSWRAPGPARPDQRDRLRVADRDVDIARAPLAPRRPTPSSIGPCGGLFTLAAKPGRGFSVTAPPGPAPALRGAPSR
jgi:hypothetical protein